MLTVVVLKQNNSRRMRTLCIFGGALALIAAATIFDGNFKQFSLLDSKQQVKRTPVSLDLPRTASRLRLTSKFLQGQSSPSRTTKLEWQQGWQQDGWQLDDGEWPDGGGRFSEGQTFDDDPATFKVHQTYAYMPAGQESKISANDYWKELQRRYFRSTPSRSTYPAVPVVFNEDDYGSHPVVSDLPHQSDDVYVSGNNLPFHVPEHHHIPLMDGDFRQSSHSIARSKRRPASKPESHSKSNARISSRLKVFQENKRLGQELAEVEHPMPSSSSNTAIRSDSAIVSTKPPGDSAPSEGQDWNAVLEMQSALYEMHKRLAQEEEENVLLRKQLSKASPILKAPMKVENNVSQATSDLQEQISELKMTIKDVESRQQAADTENEQLRRQLSSIERLTEKKHVQEASSEKTNVPRKAVLLSAGPVARPEATNTKHDAISSEAHSANMAAASKDSRQLSSASTSKLHGGSPRKLVAKPHTSATKAHQSGSSSATAVAFHGASLAAKDEVVRELAEDEESSEESEADAIFGSGPQPDEMHAPRHGFRRLHKLERSALAGARR